MVEAAKSWTSEPLKVPPVYGPENERERTTESARYTESRSAAGPLADCSFA